MAQKVQPLDELTGVTIAGRYRIISRLGAGGMGTAYRAWDEQAGIPVVIKIPRRTFLQDPNFAERFRREIRLLRGLVHPHIVPIVDDGEHEGLPFVVMRFLPGGSLSNRRLRDEQGKVRPNPPGMLHLWLPAVANALDAIHAGGVVHRDVKPANIFFDAGWGAFVGDFGIAKVIAESDVFDHEHTLTATGMGIGTPEYMAAEQFAPKTVVDGRADQYALAVIVYEIVAGVRPFTGESAHLIVEVMTQPAPRLNEKRSGLPPSLIAAVDRGLAKQPDDRFATCNEFAAAVLRDVPPLEDEPGVARLLCPKCSNILKLSTEAAGRKGSCPKCETRMKVADDLGALWLLDEARRQEESGGSGSDSEPSLDTIRPVSGTTPIGKAARTSPREALAWIDGHGLIVGGALAVAAAISWMLLATTPAPTSSTAKNAEIQRLQTEKQQLEQRLVALTSSNKALQEQVDASGKEAQKLQNDVKKLQAELAVARSTTPTDPSPTETPLAPTGDLPEQVTVSLGKDATGNDEALTLKLIPAGTFQMGSNHANEWQAKPVHEVRLTKSFYLGVTEVTNAQWSKTMGSDPPSRWKDASRPVDNATWDEAVAFCKAFSARPEEKTAGRVYRLPTEAEWEYACRAGTKTRYSFGDDEAALADHGWFEGNAGGQTQPIGQKNPNPWGLYDMHGNVLEWCNDWYGKYTAGVATDPQGPAEGLGRVFRGGCHFFPARFAPAAFRSDGSLSERLSGIGFRLALNPSASIALEAAKSTERRSEQPRTSGQPDTAQASGLGSTPNDASNTTATAGPSGSTGGAATAQEILAQPLLVNSIGMKLRLIPSGTFWMGSQDGREDEEPVHEVRLKKPFYLGINEVTNSQWKTVVGRPSNPWWANDDRPVEQMSWDDAVLFCKELSERPGERAAARVYRLPTETEWEYACRAGTTTRYSFGNDESALADHGWFKGNAKNLRSGYLVADPVGQKKANPWGLYDMHGNVLEWCSDWYGNYPASAVIDPQGPTSGSQRVSRGGCGYSSASRCGSAIRYGLKPEDRGQAMGRLGFRVAMTTSGSNTTEARE